MDSLSQIVLGAAIGEVVLGKKIGNRAMLWGAIAGTIPDLDVISNLWLSELEGLAAHRGITHSLFFAILGSGLFGFLVHRLYNSGYQRQIAVGTRVLLAVLICVGMVATMITTGSILIPMIVLLIAAGGTYFFVKNRYYAGDYEPPKASLQGWILLFFFGFLTHTLLDCFTVYGTQLFAPFSSYRVAWSTISVVDPSYTIPFLICLIIASFYHRSDKKRRLWNWAGIIWSCAYLSVTVINKQVVQSVYEQSLADQNIEYKSLLVAPTILNNILWHGVARTEDGVVDGKYSHFDSDQDIPFIASSAGDELLMKHQESHAVEVLKWFSDDYYHILRIDSTTWQFNDMRYGRFFEDKEGPNNYIFRFLLKEVDGDLIMEQSDGGPPSGEETEFMKPLWNRIWGHE